MATMEAQATRTAYGARRLSRARRREALWGMLCVAPAVLGFLLWELGPIVASLGIAFTDWNIVSSPNWVGVSNFRQIFAADELFWQALRVTVLYAGRLSHEKGVDLLADAFLAARARDPRLHLLVAGGGPEEAALSARLGGSATFLGWLEGDALAQAYARADLFLFCSQTDTFGQVVLEAQASGLPVVAVAAGGPAELVADGRSGVLCPARVDALASALAALAGSRAARERLARGGLAAVAGRSWEASHGRLAAGWRRALEAGERASAAAA
jgi:glycosyltransferase involved in cell wall biosynthesis